MIIVELFSLSSRVYKKECNRQDAWDNGGLQPQVEAWEELMLNICFCTYFSLTNGIILRKVASAHKAVDVRFFQSLPYLNTLVLFVLVNEHPFHVFKLLFTTSF